MDERRHPVAMTPMRRAIARRMAESKREIPHLYETIEIEMDGALEILARVAGNRSREERISVTALLVRAIAVSLAEHPALNAVWQGPELVRQDDVNIGVAIEVPDGLLAPAIMNCGDLDLQATSDSLRDLVTRTKAGKLRAVEMSGATFSLSNLGMFDVSQFTAIIVPPQIAILAVGRTEPRAVVRDGSIVVRRTLLATLSADHRAVDGATAARFLSTLKTNLQTPENLLVTGVPARLG